MCRKTEDWTGGVGKEGSKRGLRCSQSSGNSGSLGGEFRDVGEAVVRVSTCGNHSGWNGWRAAQRETNSLKKGAGKGCREGRTLSDGGRGEGGGAQKPPRGGSRLAVLVSK